MRIHAYIRNFLAVQRPVRTDILVVEAWLSDGALKTAAVLFRNGRYRTIVVAGIRSDGIAQSPARKAAERLGSLGVPPSALSTAEAPATQVHKTAAAGRAVKRWLENHPEVTSLNVFTQGSHARKTFIIFRKIIGNAYTIGIIAENAPKRPLRRWSPWYSAYLFKQLIGFVYASFWPFR